MLVRTTTANPTYLGNLIRRSGNTIYFLYDQSYRDWKARKGPSVLFCEGKLGSGKSVLMANMVDDLVLDHANTTPTAAFFFVSNDSTGHHANKALGASSGKYSSPCPILSGLIYSNRKAAR